MESTDTNLNKTTQNNNDNRIEIDNNELDGKPELRQRKLSGRQKYLVKQDAYDELSREKRRSRSRSNQRNMYIERDKELTTTTTLKYQDTNKRERRSLSRQPTPIIKTNYEPDELRSNRRDRSNSRMSETRLSRRSESKSREKSPRIRKTPVRLISSGSEGSEELQQIIGLPEKKSKLIIEKPRVSDEEDWEEELRIRRQQYQEKLTSDELENKNDNDDSKDISRRSSAEGKIALLTEPTGSSVMDAWTISKGPRISLESSQGPTDTEEENRYNYDFDDDKPRNINDIDEINDEFNEPIDNFVLKMPNKTKTLMDLRQLTNEDQDLIPVATGKLFKRESIIKSQASEEDPEYLLPERPKLVEQEQEHPFRKAWQMQKSKSEEDGPSAFAIKDIKQQTDNNNLQSSINDNNNKTTEPIFNYTIRDDNTKIRKAFSEESRSTSNISSEDFDLSSMPLGRFDSDDIIRFSRSTTNEMESPKLEWHSDDEQLRRRHQRIRRGSQTLEWESDET